jgi:hypothetical protein
MKRRVYNEPLSDKWDLQDEALDFIGFYNWRAMTQEQIREAVVMTDSQERLALEEYPTFRNTIRNIKRKRWHMWKAICYAMAWPEGNSPEKLESFQKPRKKTT